MIILTSQKICRTFREYLNQHLAQAIQQNLNQTSARKNGVQYKICRFCRKGRILPPSLSGFGFRPYIVETIFPDVLFGSNTTFSPQLVCVWLANCALSPSVFPLCSRGEAVGSGEGPGKMIHCKKRLAIFPSTAGMSSTKLSLAGNIFIIFGQEEFG